MESRYKLRRTLLVAGVMMVYAGLVSLPLGRTPPLQGASLALVLFLGFVIALTNARLLASPILTTRPAATALLFFLHPAVYFIGLSQWPGQSRIDLWDAFFAVVFSGIWLGLASWSAF